MFLRTRAYTDRLSVFANWPYLKKSKLYQSLRQEAVLQLGLRWLPMVSSYTPTEPGRQGQYLP